jgi:hypothetical protein
MMSGAESATDARRAPAGRQPMTRRRRLPIRRERSRFGDDGQDQLQVFGWYIASQPEAVKIVRERVRYTIREALPDADQFTSAKSRRLVKAARSARAIFCWVETALFTVPSHRSRFGLQGRPRAGWSI